MMTFKDYISEGINDVGIFKACMFSGSSACFDENTLIKTYNGYKKIKDINTDDIVLTYNEITKKQEWNQVETLYEFDNDKEILELTFDNGEVVICTEDHKFFIDDKWIQAKDL